MGIIGTVLGLVHVLQNLAAPSTLGPSISAAFIATLMGVGSANVIFLPIANRLKAISAEEVELRMMTLEGILSIQAGDNPRLVAEKLMSYLPPAERSSEEGALRRAARRRGPGGVRCRAGRPRSPPRGAPQHEESGERWLLTYADMITLLMALFMVLFSISSVNISKYQVLQHSLKAAFSGNILPGGKSIAQQGATANSSHVPSERRHAGGHAGDRAEHRPQVTQAPARAPHRASRPPRAATAASAAAGKPSSRRSSARSKPTPPAPRLRLERPDLDRTARPGHQGAHRRSAVRLGQRHLEGRARALLGEIAHC